MAEPVRACCVPRPLATPVAYRAVMNAVRERPDNSSLGQGVKSLDVLAAASVTSRHWQTGRTLRVKFLDGAAPQRKVVWDAVAAWQAHCNLGFVHESRTDRPAEVRVTFRPGGSWSYLGTDALTVPLDRPTMQIGWGPDLPTCLHEVGHMLGLIHEHQNPRGGIPWDVPKVLAYFRRTQGWDEATTRANVLDVYSERVITNDGFDPLSVMLYWFPPELLTDPSKATRQNRTLSVRDGRHVGRIYPGRPAASVAERAAADELRRLLGN